jgi:hypothetical protein
MEERIAFGQATGLEWRSNFNRRSMMKGLSVFAFLGVVLLSGCCMFAKTDAHAPVAAGNALPATVVPSSTVRLSDVSIVRQGDSLVFGGTLHPRSFMQKETGRVEIRVVDAKGRLLRELKAIPDSPVFREKGEPLPRFSVSTDLAPPEGARVHIYARE